jgi:hypothetical protein
MSGSPEDLFEITGRLSIGPTGIFGAREQIEAKEE